MNAPIMAVLLRHNSLTAFASVSQQRRSESVTLETGTSMSRVSSRDNTDFAITGPPFYLRESHSRVQDTIHEINQEVNHHHCYAENQHTSLNDREISTD